MERRQQMGGLGSIRITIEHISAVEYEARDWKQVANTGNKSDGGPVYEYVTYPSSRDISTKVFEQTLPAEYFDMKATVAVINGLAVKDAS